MAASAVGAQEPVLTLRQAIDQALGKNPEIAAAQTDAKVAGAQEALARTALWPQLDVVEDMSRGNDPVYVFGTRLRQQQFTQADFAVNSLNKPTPVGNFATRFGGKWMLFDGLGTEWRLRGARAGEQSATAMSEQEQQRIVLKVVEAYQSVLFAERMIEIARHEEKTAESMQSDATTNVKAGLAVDSDLLAAQVGTSERQQEVIAAEGAREIALAQLEEAMGVELKTEPALQPIEARDFPVGDIDEEVASAVKTRPNLEALRQERLAQDAGVRAAKGALLPQVSAYGNWEMDRASFAGSGGNNWVAGVQVQLDIFPMEKRARLGAEEAARQKTEAQERSAEGQIRLAVRSAHSQHMTAELIVKTAQASMQQATESLRIVQNRYKAGLSTMTDLLRAEDAQRISQEDYWRAVYGNVVAYTELLYATGTLTPDSAESLQ
ncbi:MAG: TolC family protein [Acidobacteriaceae bacterium]